MDERTAFNAAYWASQPPAIRELDSMERFSAERDAAAITLAAAGAIIDREIMALGNDPYSVMRTRAAYGYTWVPSMFLFQHVISLAPGIPMPPGAELYGFRVYDPELHPPGSIYVSADPSDYPAWAEDVEPDPTVEAPLIQPVGAQISAMWYQCLPDSVAFGRDDEWTGTSTMGVSGTWRLLLLAAGGFGSHRVWEKIG